MKNQLKKISPTLTLLIAAMAFSSCAHHHNDEDKAEYSQEAHIVAISSPEISEGDKLDVLREVCRKRRQISRGDEREVTSCEHEKVGTARVLKVIDAKNSSIVLDNEFVFEKGLKYEKTLSR